ncbi:DUF6501 family protein [Salibacterium qingdaonense]|uniref:Uncharacterized protein n=1 Tax=Salibacterium qingdaonense TaxID=266892 RepID=A0A1I4K3A4_9BACI|nr:DUF6501 family protein [Salibacterium qingdaonense]SFL72946.1 hypothetical protein SAMN04488054_10474 [Salibacterium qingdaonense]
MIHLKWTETETIKQLRCRHVNAKKYQVHNVLTPGEVYDVKNETEEFYFIIDDTGKIGGFEKYYFEEI